MSDWSHLSKIVGLNCEVVCLNLAGKKARSEWILFPTTRHCVASKFMYIFFPCLASSKSIKQTCYLKRKCGIQACKRRRLNLQSLAVSGVYPTQAEQAGLVSGFRHPCKAHSARWRCRLCSSWKGPCASSQPPSQAEASYSGPASSPDSTVWQQVIWAGAGDRATPSRVAEPTPAQGAGLLEDWKPRGRGSEWEGALMLGIGRTP